MKCFYAPETERHSPAFRLLHGRVVQNAEQPRRAELLLAALDQLGFAPLVPPAADRSAYEAVHSLAFLTFLETGWQRWQKLPNAGPEVIPNVFPQRATGTYPKSIVGQAGWHMGDSTAPIGEHSWVATCRSADTALAAAEALLSGDRAAYALTRPPGHHTSTDRAAGHCLMNVAAIAVERLRTVHERVAVLDIDVHHGNGTQAIFYHRPDVLTLSIHTEPDDYYPFCIGYAHEKGAGAGEGFNQNWPLPQTTTDDRWLAAIDQALERVAHFDPGALVVSLGLDAHEHDPLAGMQVSFDGFTAAGQKIAAAGYPAALIQEGGYLSDDLTTSLYSFLSGYMA